MSREPYKEGFLTSGFSQASGILVIASQGATINADIDIQVESVNEDEYLNWLNKALHLIKEENRVELEKFDRLSRASQLRAIWENLFPDMRVSKKGPGYFNASIKEEILELAKELYNLQQIKVHVSGKISVTGEPERTVQGSVFVRESLVRFWDDRRIRLLDVSNPVVIGNDNNMILNTNIIVPLNITPIT